MDRTSMAEEKFREIEIFAIRKQFETLPLIPNGP